MEDRQPINAANPLRVIAITGGKGGIGKTTISINLAIAFAKLRKKVLLFDADLGLANVDVMLGLNPNKNINDVLSGKSNLHDVCIQGPHGIKIIPSASGVPKMADLKSSESIELIRSFSSLTDKVDIMIVDLASGISNQVMDFTHAAQDVLVVICNDPASLMDSYAVIKVLHQKYARSRFGIIVNKVKSPYEGYDVFSKFQIATSKFINISLHYLGHIPQDDYIGIAARDRVSLVDKFPQSNAAISINNVAHGINRWCDDGSFTGGIQFFFERLVQAAKE